MILKLYFTIVLCTIIVRCAFFSRNIANLLDGLYYSINLHEKMKLPCDRQPARRRVCQISLINFIAACSRDVGVHRGAPSMAAGGTGGMNGGSLGKERRKGDARVQFSLRLLESGYVRLVQPPVGPRDREPCG